MLFTKVFLTSIILNFIFYSYGYFFLKIFNSKLNKFLSVFIGFSFISIITNIFYFYLNFNIQKILLLILIVLILIIIFNYLKSKYFLKIFKKQIKFFLLIIFLGSLICHFYQEQFYIFRGNFYDSTNYTSMSLLFSKFNYLEIKEFYFNQSKYYELFNKYLYIKNGFLLFSDRTLVSLITSYLYFPKIYDLFLSNFIFKIYFLSLIPLSIFLFFKYFKIRVKYIFPFSQIISLSFWPLYIFEIDAFSQLSAFSFSIISISIFYFLNKNFKKINLNDLILFSLIFAIFFSLYPEQSIIFFSFYIIYFIIYNLKNFRHIYKNLSIFIVLTFLLILTNPNIIQFIIRQISYFDQANDWWAYYGSFILGSKNLILDLGFVEKAKFVLNNQKITDFFTLIINDHLSADYKFIFLNLLPSSMGMYYLSLGKVSQLNIFNIIHILLILILNFYLIINIVKNFKNLKNFNPDIIHFFKLLCVYFFLIFIILIINFSFWQMIKLYFYFSFVLILFICIDFKNSKNLKIKLNYLIIVILLFFPIYKFSKFDHGITRIDSFPSSLNKNLKIKYNWKELLIDNKNCKKVELKEQNQFIKIIFSQYYSYNNIKHKFIDNIDKSVNCIN